MSDDEMIQWQKKFGDEHSEPKSEPGLVGKIATVVFAMLLLGVFGTACIVFIHWMITRFW
jgi:hypothetical protein